VTELPSVHGGTLSKVLLSFVLYDLMAKEGQVAFQCCAEDAGVVKK